MKKTLALLLVLSMLILSLAACSNKEDENPDTTTPSGDTAVTTEPGGNDQPSDTNGGSETTAPEETGFVKDDLPDDLNLKTTVNILYWSDVEQPEFFVEEKTGDIVTDAIFDRNITVEDRIGVKLNFLGTPGNYQNQANFVKQARASINAGGEHDIFAGYSLTGSTLAVNGCVQNLKALDYLDFDKPWWPSSLTERATINDKLYFSSGDISTNMLHMMYAVFFNKEILENYNLENPYDLVDSGDWTYNKMFEMSANQYADLNANGQRDNEDSYGLCTYNIHYDAFFTGAGLNTIAKDKNDYLTISDTFNSERTITLLEDICAFMWDGEDGTDKATGTIFSVGNTLFTLDRSYLGLRYKSEIEFDYGIVPVPKFDEAQEKYITCLGFPYTMYSISIASKQPEAAAATLECLASEGYRQVTPMLFETSMKYKYSSDNDAARMYDIIRAGVSIDIGRIFTTELNNLTYGLFRDSCRNNQPSIWSKSFKAASKVLDHSIKKINDSIGSLDS